MTLDKWIDLLAKIGGLAVLIGGIPIGFFRYFKTRTFAPRLEMAVSGQILRADGQTYLQVATRAKNIGQSSIAIQTEPSYIRISAVEVTNSAASIIEPTLFGNFDLFKNQRSLESGEAVDNLLLLKLPHDDYLAFIIEVGVFASGSEWTQTAIVNCKLQPKVSNSL